MAEEVLFGGVANAGAVTRDGPHVLRPSNEHSPAIHRFLTSLRGAGFDGASFPIGIDDDGRERFEFIEDDVPLPPYANWAQSDDEMADPLGGRVVCHNDLCLENVVFRDGIAIGLLDFDFAAPGRPEYDLAQFARMCVPIDDDTNAERNGWLRADRPRRLRLVADAYGLNSAARAEMFAILNASIERGGEFVRRPVEAGDPNFIKMWNDMGGATRFERRCEWWLERQDEFRAALHAE